MGGDREIEEREGERKRVERGRWIDGRGVERGGSSPLEQRDSEGGRDNKKERVREMKK